MRRGHGMQRASIVGLVALALGVGIGWVLRVPPAPAPAPAVTPSAATGASAQEVHDAALLDGLDRMAQGQYPEALAAFQRARAALPDPAVDTEIARVTGILDRRDAEAKAARA